MLVYHDADGRITCTMRLANGFAAPPGDHIAVPDGTDPGDPRRWIVADGALVPVADVPEDLRAEATATANRMAGAARGQFITDIPGQQMIYQAKEAEARAYAADPDPDLSAYPLIAAEVGITAPDAWGVAQVWLNMAALWTATAAALEAARLTATAAIAEAGTMATIDAALAALETALSMGDTP